MSDNKHEIPLLVLSIDPGKRKTGVAIGNTLTKTAVPLDTIYAGFEKQVARLVSLLEEWDPQLLLVGIPEASLAKNSHAYARKLADAIKKLKPVRIEFADEAYTTQIGKQTRTGYSADANAAWVLVSDWLNRSTYFDLRT